MFDAPADWGTPVIRGVLGWLPMAPKPCIIPMGRGRIIGACPKVPPAGAPTAGMGCALDIIGIMQLQSHGAFMPEKFSIGMGICRDASFPAGSGMRLEATDCDFEENMVCAPILGVGRLNGGTCMKAGVCWPCGTCSGVVDLTVLTVLTVLVALTDLAVWVKLPP